MAEGDRGGGGWVPPDEGDDERERSGPGGDEGGEQPLWRRGEGEGGREGMTSGDPLSGAGSGGGEAPGGGGESRGAESAFGREEPTSAESAFGGEQSRGAESAFGGGWEPPSEPSQRPGGWEPPGGASQPGGWEPPAGPSQQPGGWQPPAGGGQPDWGQAPGGGQPPGGYVVPTSNGKATASLVLGIVGLVVCPLICSVAAIVLGYQARGEIDASQGRQHNRGSATAGIITGWIGLAFGVILVILIVIGAVATETDGGSDEPLSEPAALLAARVLLSLPLL